MEPAGMIDPAYLAALRRQYRAELVLVLVQLEQQCPGWWESLEEMAEQFGTDRATLNRSMRHLEDRGLIRRHSISNRSGTWIWWVKRNEGEEPIADDEPGWVLRSTTSKWQIKIPISQRRVWAERRGIPLPTLIGFLHGRQKVLRGQWQLVSTPHD
jgi:hypothetical protein